MSEEEFEDYESFAEKPLVFPIGGRKYVLPALSIEAGLKLSGIITGKDKQALKLEGVELWKLVLGPLWEQMVADGVPLAAATRAGLSAAAYYQYGREAAAAAWQVGADPKRIAAYMEAQTAALGNRASRRSKSTGAANATRTRASSNTTKSRKN